MKHLTIGDLHLYDREMRSTKKMIQNSSVILDELYNFLKEHEEIVFLNINGDIQHTTPVNKYKRKEVAYWRYMFRKIGHLMNTRFRDHVKGFKLVGADEETKKMFKEGEINPIFTTKGNHDMDNELDHTFYDELLEEGLIMNVDGLLLNVEGNKTFFSYRDYGIEKRKLPKLSKDTDIIALEHNDVLHDESVLWNVPKAEEKFTKAEEAVKGTDVTILGHIHDKVDPLYIGEEGSPPVLWQVGSVARTAFRDSDKRDVGYGAVMEFGDVETFLTAEFDLIPFKEYFSYQKMMRNKEYENAYKDFSLKMEEQERVAMDYKEDINSFEEVDQDVKEYAIKVMDTIKNNE